MTEKNPPKETILYYVTSPGVALRDWQEPYHFTGVIDRTWVEACQIVGRPYTSSERSMGWPCAMEPHRLACLQAPHDPTGQTYVYTAMEGGCRLGRLPCKPFERHDYEILKNGERKLAEVWTDYAITPLTFFAWLTNQREQPSRFIEAWFQANGLHWKKPQTPAPEPVPAAPQPAPQPAPAPKRKKADAWFDATKDYLVNVTRTQGFATAKELTKHLHDIAGDNTPFRRSTQRDKLFVDMVGKPIADSTIEKKWGEIRAIANGRTPD